MHEITEAEQRVANEKECMNCGANEDENPKWCAVVTIPSYPGELLCCCNCGKLYSVQVVEMQDLSIKDGYTPKN